MHNECFPDKGWAVAKKVIPIVQKHKAVLAGGTALALHLGHRISIDLDFFTSESFLVDEVVYEIGELGVPFKILDQGSAHVVAVIDGVKFSLFKYPYSFIAPIVTHKGMSVAGIVDIAAMKVVAISQRGTKRDFVDLYCILQTLPFNVVADNMVKRFGEQRINAVHIGKSLTCFTDAEIDAEPNYLPNRNVDWGQVKAYFKKNAKSLFSHLSQRSG